MIYIEYSQNSCAAKPHNTVEFHRTPWYVERRLSQFNTIYHEILSTRECDPNRPCYDVPLVRAVRYPLDPHPLHDPASLCSTVCCPSPGTGSGPGPPPCPVPCAPAHEWTVVRLDASVRSIFLFITP